MMKKSLFIVFAMNVLLILPLHGQERLLTDEMGRKVKINNSPKRMISLAPSITETLFALGLNDEIVGITSFCDYPEVVSCKPKIGGFVNPSFEKIVSLKPDLVIATKDGNRRGTIQKLEDLGISVYTIDPKDFDGTMSSIKTIGEIVGKRDESKRIIDDMRKKKKTIVELTHSLPRPMVFFQVGFDPIVTVGRGTLADDLIRLAGGRNISRDESVDYPIYSLETIISKVPEVIIMSSMESQRDYLSLIKMWQGWSSIPAVKRKAIFVIHSNLVDRPGPRIVEGLEAMARLIHPEALGNRK